MEMKWHPIIDGDLSEVPIDESFLVTGIDNGELYVEFGYIESRLDKQVFVCIGDDIELPVEAKNVKAWMELPEPYQPGRCDICKHWKEWIDEYGDGCAECKLLKNVPFTKIKFGKCPLEK